MSRLSGAPGCVSTVHMTLVSKHLKCMPRMVEFRIVPCRIEHPDWHLNNHPRTRACIVMHSRREKGEMDEKYRDDQEKGCVAAPGVFRGCVTASPRMKFSKERDPIACACTMRRPVCSLFVCLLAYTHTHSHTALQASDAGAGLWVSDCCQHGVWAGHLWSIECSHLERLPHCDHAVRICSQATTMDSSLVSTSADVSPVSSSSSLEEDADASSSSDPLPEPFAIWCEIALSQRFLLCLSHGSFGSISVSPSLPPSLAPSYPSITPLIFVNHISFTLISISISIARSFSLSLSLSQHMCIGASFSRWTMQA